MRSQLIVGIDPGTTTAVTLLDMQGRLVSIRSGRNLSKSAVAEMISSKGDPVIIASDTFPAPRAIEKLAAAFFARLVTPAENLKREDKAS
ncbi:MAG: DUF460 domain-containing protein, partial [Candidatus Aenigmarchaeota archaeon]|nr:DUF460 domain-containing protein [Candidatus Aenigmarchaeota archaeon]